VFGNSWGQAFYGSDSAGRYLRVLAPLVPLTYLDVVVDNLLKGLDEQFNSMKYNFTDSLIRVVLVLCLLRFFGMESYVCILFFSTIFNASMSLHRLMKVSRLHISVGRHILLPLSCAVLAVCLGRSILQGIVVSNGFVQVFVETAVSGVIFAGSFLGLDRLTDLVKNGKTAASAEK